ncbi:MAG: hypothetical protein GF308_18345 [Candidatus Heimdallarchaeota archaeon]|nr:hypothetical protein [Candidatus Heimdallarchaeota archaeon]
MKEWMGRREPLNCSTIRNIIRLVLLNKGKIHPKYWYRLLVAWITSWLFLPIRIIERIRFYRKIKKTKITHPPIFIIGHWRTGTTFLHYLMAEDKSKAFVSNLDAYGANFSLVAGKFTKKIVRFAIPEKRPMDDVLLSIDRPGEEEFAMAMKQKQSFYHAFVFPQKIEYFSRFITFKECSKKEVTKWKKGYYFFIQKICWKNHGKQLILKSPPNTGRVQQLVEMFPEAKFIFLTRNPYEIFASTTLLFKRLLPYFSLQKWNLETIQQNILKIFKEMHEEYERSKESLPKNQLIEIRYEDLITEPLEELKRIYQQLKIDGFEENKKFFEQFISTQKDYKKNIHEISKTIISTVNNHWTNYFKKYLYEKVSKLTK